MSYITGDGFRNKCSIVIDRIVNINSDVPAELLSQEWKAGDIIYYQKEYINNNWIFCHPEYFQYIKYLNIDLTDKILFTHRSDININYWNGQETYLSLGPNINFKIDHLNPKKWFGINVNCDSVGSIPIGLYEERHNKMGLIKKVEEENVEKEHILYLNFNPNSNKDRLDCLKYTKLFNHFNPLTLNNSTQEIEYNYLLDLKKSYFILSPNGFGVDCHRHWESIQMGAIPIVTKSKHIENLSKYFPFFILNSWEEFNKEEFTKEKYLEIWDNFDKRYLDLNFLVDKII